MNQTEALTLSLIIPAYNEERHIEGCLHSVQQQTVMPDEVIVVDNNSTDRTVEIAQRFPFVKVVHEKTQGLIAARDHGFRIAEGSILGRIDCDARLQADWVERVKDTFKSTSVAATTGAAETNILPFVPWPHTRLFAWSYHILARSYFKMPVLWGSNMALRRSAWKEIAGQTSSRDDLVHEDLDLSILLWSRGYRVHFDPDLRIYTGGEQFLYIPKLLEYTHRRKMTRRHHEAQQTLRTAQQCAGVHGAETRLKTLALLPVGLLFAVGAVVTTVLKFLARLFGKRIIP